MLQSLRKSFSIGLLFAFLVNTLGPMPANAQEFLLPKPGVMVHLSLPMNPPMLKGIRVHTDNPFRFEFILDKGDEVGNGRDRSLTDESTRLIKYFLASLTVPEKDLWVNLSPYEKDRIVPQSFGQTEMGRDLLAQDYLLKQITASLIYPEDELGKKFWKRIYAESIKKYGSANIPVNTFNKVWIVPEKAVVYENAKAGTAYVVESRLKVMLEVDYLAQEKHSENMVGAPFTGAQNIRAGASPAPTIVNEIGSQIIREIVIPELTREVNEGTNFSQLRQVYNSLILATWYKKKIKDSILSKVYADQNKVAGVGYSNSLMPETIYQQYLSAFKKGVYNYIKEEQDPANGQPIPKKYFSGGAKMIVPLTIATDAAMLGTDRLDQAQVVKVQLISNNSITDPATTTEEDLEPLDFLPKILLNKKTGRIKFASETPKPVIDLGLTLWALRHGPTLASVQKRLQGVKDVPGLNDLTEIGRQKSFQAAEDLYQKFYGQDSPDRISDDQILVIVTSEKNRTIETSQPFIEKLKLMGKRFEIAPLDIAQGANPISFGVADNMLMEEIEDPKVREQVRRYKDLLDAKVRINGGDSFLDVLQRSIGWLEELKRRYHGRTVLVFSHGLSGVRVALGDVHSVDASGYINWRSTVLPNLQPLLLYKDKAQLSSEDKGVDFAMADLTKAAIDKGAIFDIRIDSYKKIFKKSGKEDIFDHIWSEYQHTGDKDELLETLRKEADQLIGIYKLIESIQYAQFFGLWKRVGLEHNVLAERKIHILVLMMFLFNRDYKSLGREGEFTYSGFEDVLTNPFIAYPVKRRLLSVTGFGNEKQIKEIRDIAEELQKFVNQGRTQQSRLVDSLRQSLHNGSTIPTLGQVRAYRKYIESDGTNKKAADLFGSLANPDRDAVHDQSKKAKVLALCDRLLASVETVYGQSTIESVRPVLEEWMRELGRFRIPSGQRLIEAELKRLGFIKQVWVPGSWSNDDLALNRDITKEELRRIIDSITTERKKAESDCEAVWSLIQKSQAGVSRGEKEKIKNMIEEIAGQLPSLNNLRRVSELRVRLKQALKDMNKEEAYYTTILDIKLEGVCRWIFDSLPSKEKDSPETLLALLNNLQAEGYDEMLLHKKQSDLQAILKGPDIPQKMYAWLTGMERFIRDQQIQFVKEQEPLVEAVIGQLKPKGNMEWWIETTFADILKRETLFLLSSVVLRMKKELMRKEKISGWEVIVRGRLHNNILAGRLHYINIDGLSSRELVKAIRKVKKDEILVIKRLPNQVLITNPMRGIITLEYDGHVSHPVIRARRYNRTFLVAPEIETLSPYFGQNVTVCIQGQDVRIEKSNEVLAPTVERPRKVRKEIHVHPIRSRREWIILPEDYSSDIVTNKILNLGLLDQEDVTERQKHAQHFALGVGLYESVARASENNQRIIKQIEGLKKTLQGPFNDTIRGNLRQLRNLTMKLKINKADLEKIQKTIKERFGSGVLVFMRSASNAEDQQGYAGAGLYDSYGAINPKEWDSLERYIKMVWAGMFEERAYIEHESNGIDHEKVVMEVLVHKMVDAEYSFIIHTQNPTAKNPDEAHDEVYGEFVQGLGEGGTSGSQEFRGSPHGIVYNRRTKKIHIVSYANKDWKLTLDEQRSLQLSLTDYADDIFMQHAKGLNSLLERVFERALYFRDGVFNGVDQDLEGCLLKNGESGWEFVFVQSRPQQEADEAMVTDNFQVTKQETGGIDFTSNEVLQVQKNEGEIKFNLDPAMLEQFQKTKGFTPLIVDIQPLSSLSLFLGI